MNKLQTEKRITRGKTHTMKREIGGSGANKTRHPASVGFKGSSEKQGARVTRKNK